MQHIILLQNIRQIIQAEKLCKAANIQVSIIPVPSHLSSECGMALVAEHSKSTEIKYILEKEQLKPIIYER